MKTVGQPDMQGYAHSLVAIVTGTRVPVYQQPTRCSVLATSDCHSKSGLEIGTERMN
jgi:hypothetical protein